MIIYYPTLHISDDVLNRSSGASNRPVAEHDSELYKTGMDIVPKLRVARASDDLDALIPFYSAGLGLTVIYRFADHDGFDGLMFGHERAPYHFEFTRAHGHVAGRAPTKDNLLVFYIPEPAEWSAAVARMRKAGFDPVPAFNAYWDRNGCTFEDPDGYRVVIQKASWIL